MGLKKIKECLANRTDCRPYINITVNDDSNYELLILFDDQKIILNNLSKENLMELQMSFERFGSALKNYV